MTEQHARSTVAIAVLILALCGVAPDTSAAKPARKGALPSGSAANASVRLLCDALHTLPDARRAACCAGTANGVGLADACARSLGDALARGVITLDAREVKRCAADAARELDGCDWVTPQAPRLPASCRSLVHGRVAAGASCRSSLECVDGLACWGASAKADGICAPPGATGASCGRGEDALATFVRASGDERHPECAGFCGYGRCASRVATGGACAAGAQCASGNRCVAGRCIEGAPPRLGEDCTASACAGGLACVDGRCAAPRKPGESCSRPSDCAATCLPPNADGTRVCGMQCDAFPGALRLPPAPKTASALLPHG